MIEKDAIECVERLKKYNLNGELATPENRGVSMLWDGTFGMVLDMYRELQAFRAIGLSPNEIYERLDANIQEDKER